MDYLFFATLRNTTLLTLIISYDIACQWSVNLWKRLEDFPDAFRFNPESRTITFLIPKFHLSAHKYACHINYSFNLTKFVGRTDGEGVERGWSQINAIAPSTKEMGPGSRRDTIDDHFSDSNWKKIVGMGKYFTEVTITFCELTVTVSTASLFLRKGREAGAVCSDHVVAHELLEKALPPSDVTKWKKDMEAWEADSSRPNPFEMKSTCEYIV
jgi:hypothetical protein